ncbi:MAG TPA: ABC transporter substrate-binding protein [Candidatus Avacidaminococcus intestinavium]|uniref:ABC transporter substrate-binding protein n=1 Tax=Candidatus Avacidaminococcus intestinavium TaxID=2840684 RepID=A0A9D1SL13_9FIRM|nr:ABC transporter substrate-binding protein [Candidatus Avacidaminococcus intestinavium]
MKKSLTLLCVGAMSLALVGCGGAKEQKSADGGKVKIEYWHVASESFGGATVKELVEEFNKTHPNIEVTEKYNPDMYKGLTQNLQAAIASGKNPDVVQMGWSYLNYAADNLKYTDIPKMVEEKIPEDKNFLKDNYLPNVLALARTDDGRQVGVPYSISVPVLFYNPEIFKAAGLDPANPPKTWKEVQAAAKQIKEKTGNMGFFMQEFADNWAQQALLESNGGTILKKENGKTKAGFSSPESAEAYQLIADMVKDGSGLHATNEEGFQAYLSGKLGMVCTTIGKRANFEKTAKFEVMASAFPSFEGKQLKVPAGGNFLMVFSTDDAKQKAAWEFIKFIESPGALAKWSTGTGYLPPRKDVEQDPNGFKKMIEENKNIQAALSTMPYLVQWASFPGANGLQAEQLLIDVRDVILSGKQTAADALKETEDKINKLL